MITIAWHEIISWAFALIAVVLFIVERRKNDGTKYYMAIQGIIKSCSEKMKFYAVQATTAKKQEISITQDYYRFLVESVYTDNLSLMQSLMGIMKAIEPNKEMPFDLPALLDKPSVKGKENEL